MDIYSASFPMNLLPSLSLSLFKCIFKNHHLSVLFFFKARSQLCKVKFLSSLSTHTLLYLNFARMDERSDTRICFFLYIAEEKKFLLSNLNINGINISLSCFQVEKEFRTKLN